MRAYLTFEGRQPPDVRIEGLEGRDAGAAALASRES